MGTWTSNNKLYLTGSITSGLVLSAANADSGTIPADMILTTYNDFNYGSDYYEYKAIFEGAFSADYYANVIEWTATASIGTIKYQYALSGDGITYDDWTALSSATLTKSAILANTYFKIRFVLDGGNWSDNDYLKVISVNSSFTPFVKKTIIESAEMNANFQFVGMGNFLPRGGSLLLPTSSIYNLGSSTYPWNKIYCNNINVNNEVKKSLTLVAKTKLSTTATRIEFSGLNGDNYSYFLIIGKIKAINNTTTGYDIKMIFNGDSATSYGYFGITKTITTSYISLHMLDTIQATNYNDMVECYIKCRSGNEKLSWASSLFGGIGSTAPSLRITAGIWSSDVTLTSIVLYTSAQLNTDTTFYIYGLTI